MAASLRLNLTGEDLESCTKCRDDLSAGILGGTYMYKYFFPCLCDDDLPGSIVDHETNTCLYVNAPTDVSFLRTL